MQTRAIFLGTLLFLFFSALSSAQAPVPFINLPLVPDATAPGGPEFTLTVNGTGFVSNSVVNWNGTALATQYVSQSQLTATVPAANIATANTGWITVVNPAPGGGASNTAFFTVIPKAKYVVFASGSSTPVGSEPLSAAAGDFNGDGKLDLAVGDESSNEISILLGDGKGNFTLGPNVISSSPTSVVVGDFNGDGKLDLAVASEDDTVSVLLGDGTGNFTLASSLAVSSSTVSLAVGDFNGDGNLDLAVAGGCYACNGTVSILLGDGTGNFTLASSPAVGMNPTSVAVGDFNGDGKLDLVTANSLSVSLSVLLGDGTGNFTQVSSPSVSGSPFSVAVADFNRDGKLDLAVMTLFSGTVSILLGDGTGQFSLASSPEVGVLPQAIVVGDFNGDGKPDLAVVPGCYACSDISILLGDGTGNFNLAASPVVQCCTDALVVGDFNGDGQLDLAFTSRVSETASTLLQVPASPAVALSPTSLTFGAQLVGTASTPQTVTLTNTGSGTLNITSIVASANFSGGNNCGHSLAPGASCTISVTFRPQAVGTLTGTITITDNAPNSPQTVSLSGTGTVVGLSPSGIDFGDQPVGTISPPQTVTFTNYASRALTIQGIRIAGNSPRPFAQTNTCGTSVPAGGSCTISVTFTPITTGGRNATLEVYDNGGASPQAVALSGTGT